jgi:hypothetical protein
VALAPALEGGTVNAVWDRRAICRSLLGGLACTWTALRPAAAQPAAGAGVPPPLTAAELDELPAPTLWEGSMEPSRASLQRPLPGAVSAAAAARLQAADDARRSLRALADALRLAHRQLRTAEAAVDVLAGGAPELQAAAARANKAGAELFAEIWSAMAAAEEALAAADAAERAAIAAHRAALLRLDASLPDSAARVDALRAAGQAHQARRSARRALRAAVAQVEGAIDAALAPARRAGSALLGWSFVQGRLADAASPWGLQAWTAAAQAGVALRRRATAPEVLQALAFLGLAALPPLPAALAAAPWPAVPGEPAGPVSPTIPASPASHDARPDDRLDARRAQLARADAAQTAADRAGDAGAWLAMAMRDADPPAADCGGERCDRFEAEAQAVRREQAAAAEALAQERRAAAEGLQRVRATPADWQSALARARAGDARLQPALAAAASAVSALARERAALDALAEPVLAAEQAAVRSWILAWQAVHGIAPDGDWRGRRAMAAPAPSMQGAPPPILLGEALSQHALHRLAELYTEPQGFGAYTYVIVTNSLDRAQAPVRQRLLRIERVLRDLVAAGSVSAPLRASFNVFVMPTGAQRPDADGLAYDVRLAQQLMVQLPPGWSLPQGLRQARQRGSGPFLLTLPGPLTDAQPGWPVLFADLSDAPPLAVTDVVKAYMDRLLDGFDTGATQWRPGVALQVAMTLVRLSQSTGDVVSAFFPAAVAAPR